MSALPPLPRRTVRSAAAPSRRLRCAALALCLTSLLSGCAVVAVTSTAVSITAGAVGLAADAAIGTAKIVGKGVGATADLILGDDSDSSAQ